MRGSWAQIDGLPETIEGTLTVEASLTRNETPRTLLDWGDVAITVDPAGRIQLRVGVRRAADERTAARRADIAFRTHEGGGFVLSVGSVAWCGALPEAGQENPVGTLTRNILFHLKGDRS